MQPYEITAIMIAKATPRYRLLRVPKGRKFIEEPINDLVRVDSDHPCLDLDLTLVLDRFFSLTSGYWWRLLADYEV